MTLNFNTYFMDIKEMYSENANKFKQVKMMVKQIYIGKKFVVRVNPVIRNVSKWSDSL